MKIGYHASHEQYAPGELLDFLPLVEEAGFVCIMSSDHFAPWSERQGQSGFVWSWLGAAMGRTSLPFGTLAIPIGLRFHPVLIAQAAATLCDMYPGQLQWLALGSGEALNENMVGKGWPPKEERNARLMEGADILRRLFSGEEVSTDGIIKTDRAKLWTLPRQLPSLYAAALTKKTAEKMSVWADGITTVRKEADELKDFTAIYRDKKKSIQLQICWAKTKEEALEISWKEWRNAALRPEQLSDLRTPQELDQAGEELKARDMDGKIVHIGKAEELHALLDTYEQLGFDEVYIHHVGRNQKEFISFCGSEILKSRFQSVDKSQSKIAAE
jgi:coenzyme F420-dependent glucose-6-phosphate dehydrogenase